MNDYRPPLGGKWANLLHIVPFSPFTDKFTRLT